jgi:hypothetical protein
MLSWCKTRRAAVLFGIGGVLLVALLVHRLAPAGNAVKKAAKPLSIPQPAQPETAQAPAPIITPPAPPFSPGPPAGTAPAPSGPYSPPAALPTNDLANKSIDQLLIELDEVRTKKGEMDRQEKKLITVLRQKLSDQEQCLRKHGLIPFEAAVPAGYAPGNGPASNATPAPRIVTPPDVQGP